MEKVTPKQFDILILLYRFRFLDRTHIQRFLNHKDPKRINTWLKDLTDRNIIGRHYSRKLLENTKPAIYYLVTKSKQILETRVDIDSKLLKRIYREKTRSKRFIDHHLLLADIYFYLQASANNTNSQLHFFTKTDLAKHYYLPYKRPDAYIAVEKDRGIKRYFLEIIDEETPRFMLRKLIERYIEYLDDNKWHNTTGYNFPAVLLACPNNTIKNYLYKHISQVLEEEAENEIEFFLTTRDLIQESEMKASIWRKAGDERSPTTD